jgi:hypothetical protein
VTVGAWDAFVSSAAPSHQSSAPADAWGAFLQPYLPQQTGNVSSDWVVKGLVARGLTPTMAQGIAMNIQDESGFNPGVNEKGGGGGYGLIQLTGPRRTAYEAYAAQQDVSPSDPNAQLDYIVNELHTTQRAALQKMQAAQTPGQAADAFLRYDERPAQVYLDQRSAKYLGASPDATSTPAPDYSTLWLPLVNGSTNG